MSHFFLPHGFCLGWPGPPVFPPWLVIFHILGDLSGVIVYPLLAIGISWWARRSWAMLPSPWHTITLATAAFLVLCGGTHLMDILTLVWPAYYLQAAVKVSMGVAATIALVTAYRELPRLRLAQTMAYVRSVAEALGEMD